MSRRFYWLCKYFFYALLTDSHGSSNCVRYRSTVWSIFRENTAGYRAYVIGLSECVYLNLKPMDFKKKKTHKHKKCNPYTAPVVYFQCHLSLCQKKERELAMVQIPECKILFPKVCCLATDTFGKCSLTPVWPTNTVTFLSDKTHKLLR